MVNCDITMKSKNTLKLLLAMALLGTPATAQVPNANQKKYDARAREFAEFMLYWSNWNAYESVSRTDRRRAERTTYECAYAKMPELVRDSVYMADKITKGASIINKKYDLQERPDYVYTWFELFYIHEQKNADKNSSDYILADNLKKYIEILKQLKLARYTMQINQK